MPIRTNPDAVKAVLSGGCDYNGTSDLTPYIAAASSIVNRVKAAALGAGTTATDADWKVLETWLAAWAYACSDLKYSQKTTGKASASFQGQTGMGLDSNTYGQTAKILDPSGGWLDAIVSRKVATADWLGLPPSEQLDYDQRD